MTLLALEQWIARSVLDPGARDASGEALGERERALLRTVDDGELAWLARVVHADRAREIAAHAPWTLAALRHADGAIRAFGARHASREATALRETSAFLRWLKPRASEHAGAAWLDDALAYELAVVRLQLGAGEARARVPDRGPALARGVVAFPLAHDLAPLAADPGAEARPSRTGYVLARAPRGKAVNVWRVPAWCAVVLARADGSVPRSDLAERAGAGDVPGGDVDRLIATAAARGLLRGSGA